MRHSLGSGGSNVQTFTAMQAWPASFALTSLVWSSHAVLSVVSQTLYTRLSPPQAFAQSLLQSPRADCVSILCSQLYSEMTTISLPPLT